MYCIPNFVFVLIIRKMSCLLLVLYSFVCKFTILKNYRNKNEFNDVYRHEVGVLVKFLKSLYI